MEQLNFLDVVDGNKMFKVTKQSSTKIMIEYFCEMCNMYHFLREVHGSSHSIVAVSSAISGYLNVMSSMSASGAKNLSKVLKEIDRIATLGGCKVE
jgi:hypothetical protein